jgi:hypothetical protein
LKKRTSINSIRNFHKEKEMADFRKWLIAFAAMALLLGLSTSASAQIITSTAGVNCAASAANPPTVRAEGVTELVGDVVLLCTGGTPTAAGQPIPESNIQIFLNTNVTSRLYSINNLTEALILIDEPYPGGSNPPVPGAPQTAPAAGSTTTQLACQATNSTNCAITGNGGGVGAAGPYNGSAGHYNIFQGALAGANSLVWLGVPIDAPGTTATREIRITNVRANACQLLSAVSTLIPTQITMFITVTGSQQVTLNNPTQTVAAILPGLVVGNRSVSLLQCQNSFGTLISSSAVQGQTNGVINITATEGFASAFKVRSYSQIISPGAPDTPASLQNVPGFPYNTESGFVSNAPGLVNGGTGAGAVGLADTGTEFTFNFAGIGQGVSLFAPSIIYLTPAGISLNSTSSNATGFAVLVNGLAGGQLSSTGTGTAAATYEVVASNVNVLEQVNFPVTVAFISNTGSNLPTPGTSTVGATFAPLIPQNPVSNTTASSGPIPRFCPRNTPANFLTITICSCNLLFPFVTNQAGFDTGIAIANTSQDTLNGVVPQQGTVTLAYFGTTTGGGAAPANQVSQVVPAGSELVFNLSGGGNLGIAATPGFQGYIVARANFQWCHAFAFISDLGAQRLAEGYLAIQLDVPVVTVNPALPTGLNRTGVAGENEGH